ncbi:Gp5.5-like host HNS inhibition [Dickeya phage Katbat]|uniref:Phage protein n=3 Tax=Aarhusvirus TaxID=2732675 RepID=A0A2S1GSQ2_9CAUD|nr:Gp5.5-like host HNS inhibition [Dickeya phage Dagda]YP_009811894.1 Gp5.5-like host HNS inhibition [Dickeya phage Katbat]AWD92379.1 hypothetical protein [Dickeya phage Dagda]AXY81631.1 hypothetical protein [Dickeya phage Dagda_B1]AXY81743.1 hypothetical protein [Dickeya phage Katbat]
MALTIKQKVSFDVKFVVDSETEKTFESNILEAIRGFHAGTRELEGLERYVVTVFLKEGLEAAITAIIAGLYKGTIKEAFLEDLDVSSLSPVVVRNV